jgi:RHS repeat-associated protein
MSESQKIQSSGQNGASTPEGANSPFTPPQISLPKGGGAIRGIGEKFSANVMMGTFSFSVPIALTPARSGFTPQLSLTHSSGLGNGPFGLGWDLSLPSITRKTDKGLPRYADWEESDVFILSGAEDLVPTLKEDSRGAWIDDEITRGGYRVRQYRPRVEGLFARIERWTQVESGEAYWRTISKDNIVTFYGLDDESRIFDPANRSHIFSWLISQSFDSTGNGIVYEYVRESDYGVDVRKANERNRERTANCYLKRVRYGNRRPVLFDSENASFRRMRATQDELNSAGWMFEALLDYGDCGYSETVPDERSRVFACVDARRQCNPLGTVRRDPFSSYRSGFEVRTYRLCHRFLLFHHFPDELGAGAYLVRSTALGYDQKSFGTFLTKTTQSGFKRWDDRQYLKKSLPSVQLQYSYSSLEEVQRAEFAVREVSGASLENMPGGIDGKYYRWVDLDGEGISGVLSEQARAWFYKPNLGGGRFGPTEVVAPSASLKGLNSGQVQLMDVAGDGNLDLVGLAQPTPGYYERTREEGWRGFRAFPRFPVQNWNDPNLRFVDLTGDGLADILITEDEAFWWRASERAEGFGGAIRVTLPDDEEKGPRVVFANADQSIYLADMSGDGLSDIVRIRNGEVCYWPNLGYGRFGAKVTLDNSPYFDEKDVFDQRRIHLADTDGSGTTDIVYFSAKAVHIFLNESGNSLSDARVLEGFPATNDLSAISVVDFLGRGTACLVWSSSLPGDARRPLRYVDLMCGRKPHLLQRVVNNLGAETTLQYASSSEFYLRDKAAGHPWLTHLPFPVHLVERLETIDRISHNRFVSSYSYHHGYYDGVEREFRGFGRVDQLDSEEFAALGEARAAAPWLNENKFSQLPPTLTKTWFHTGVFLGELAISRHMEREYYLEGTTACGESALTRKQRSAMLLDDTILPEHLTPDETREACRALKSGVLRQEIYALDVKEESCRPYTVTESNFTIRTLQPRESNRHAVFFSHAHEAISFNYERKLYAVDGGRRADPRVTHSFTLKVDEYGNIERSVNVGYGRRFADPAEALTADEREMQKKILLTLSVNRYTNVVMEPDAYRTPFACESFSYELLHVRPKAHEFGVTNLFGFEEIEHAVEMASDGKHDLPFEDLNAEGAVEMAPYRRLFQRSRSTYRSNRLEAILPLATIQSLALPGENYKLVFTPGLLARIYRRRDNDGSLEDLLPHAAKVLGEEGGYVDLEHNGHWWSRSGRVFYSQRETDDAAQEFEQAKKHFFLPQRFRDPFGNVGTVEYDAHKLVPVFSRDAVGNISRATIDYRVLAPYLKTDPNGNRVQVSTDALGMVVGTAVMGKESQNLGDSLAGFVTDPDESTIREHLRHPLHNPWEVLQEATSRTIYDLFGYQRTREEAQPQPAVVYSLVRETHASDLGAGERTKVLNGFSYSDGFGREIQKKAQAEPGPLVEGGPKINQRWICSGWSIFNNKGKVVRQYEPFFSATQEFEFAVMVGVSPTFFYDPVARVVATLHPNHTYEKVVFDSWRQNSWDVNDTVLVCDPERDADVGDFFARLPKDDYLPTWYEQRKNGELGHEEAIAAEKAAVHADTPSTIYFDSLGRSFLTVAHNRFARDAAVVNENITTLTKFDIQNDQIAVIDALQREIMSYDYDMSKTKIHQKGADAGQRWSLSDVGGTPLRTWDSRGHEFRYQCDALRRPTNLLLKSGVAQEKLIERIVYGEGQPDDLTRNLRARIAKQFDEAGLLTNKQFDFKANLVSASRQLLADYRAAGVDWSGPPELEADVYESANTYDALNRIVTSTTPDASVVRPYFNDANLLNRVEVNLRGAAEATLFVNAIQYNARGQREFIAYGNGARTRLTYDPVTFRLSQLKTMRHDESGALQDLGYTYDPVGNITFIRDAAQENVYFKNQVVSASNSYTYDAVYRLLAADGREHIGQLSEPQLRNEDAPRLNQPLPSDGHAMRRYREFFQYDVVGNILKMSHTAMGGEWTRHYRYDEPQVPAANNRLSSTRVGEFTEHFTYDADGNMTRMAHLPVMEWDFKDRLRATQRQVVKDRPGEKTYYVYTAAGQRVRKVTEGTQGKKLHERIYLGGFELYREYSHEGDVKLERETLHIMDDKRRIALVETKTIDAKTAESELPSTLTRYQFGNQLGSSTLELDESAAVITYEEYYPYGSSSYESVRRNLEVSPKRYRYMGKERDDETDLYYYGARYYAAWLGRWTIPDPAGLVDGSNSYTYVRNNPVRLTDANGLQSNDDLNALGTSHDTPVKTAPTPEETAKEDAAADAKKKTDSNTIVPDPWDPDLQDPQKPKADPANLWLAQFYQGIGKPNNKGTIEAEANLGGAASRASGLGESAHWGGGLNTASLAIRKFADLESDLQSFDIGAAGSFSYLSSGGFGPGRFPNGASAAITGHYALKFDNDWGGAIYASGGASWSRDPDAKKWLGATGGGTGTLVLGHEPDDGVGYGLNIGGSYLSEGQLGQGPTLRNITSGTAVLSAFGNVADGVNLSGELFGSLASGSGTTDAVGGTGQSGSAKSFGAGIGIAISKVGPLTLLDEGTPKTQTNTISFNLDYRHEAGGISGPGTTDSPSGRYAVDSLFFMISVGMRQLRGGQ